MAAGEGIYIVTEFGTAMSINHVILIAMTGDIK